MRTFKRHLHLDFIYARTKLYQRERQIVGTIEAMIDRILAEKATTATHTSDAMPEIKKEFQLNEQSNSHIFIDQLMHLTQDGRYLTPLEIRQNIIAIIFAVRIIFFCNLKKIPFLMQIFRDTKQRQSPLRMQF